MLRYLIATVAGVLSLQQLIVSAQQPGSFPAPALNDRAVALAAVSQVSNFERRCTACHDNPESGSHAPSREALRALTPERVLAAITTGPMAVNAQGMTDDQKRAMAELVTGKPVGGETARAARGAAAMSNGCPAPLRLEDPWNAPRWNGWSPDPETGWRLQSTASAGLTADRLRQLKLKWAFGLPGAGAANWGQPSIVGGKLFIASDNGFLYALDARSGCVHCSFEAQGQTRTAPVIANLKGVPGVRYAAFFGDYRGNVYAIDAETGRQIWIKRVDEHEGAKITGTPVIDAAGRLYVPVTSWEEIPGVELTYKCCTFQGSIVAMDAATGRQIWKTYTLLERPRAIGRTNTAGTVLMGPAGSGVWNPPTLDIKNKRLYVGTGNSYIVTENGDTDDAIMAFDLETGQRLWWTHMGGRDPHAGGCGNGEDRRINCPGYIDGRDDDASGAPVLYAAPDGKRYLIEGQESGRVTAVDPDQRGRVLWVAQAGNELGVPNAGFGGAFDGEFYFKGIPFADQTGAVAALRATTGERVWYTVLPKPVNCPDPSPQSCHSGVWAAASAIPGAVFFGSRDGTFRAFSSRDGKILWEFATNRTFDTVNGVPGRGGAIGGTGPAIVNGMVYIGSGFRNGSPGNVLLAFGVE